MSTEVSAVATSAPQTIRHTADFKPTLWGDQFLKRASEFKPTDATTQEEYDQLKQEVRRMIMDTADMPAQKLNLIDAVQRLCVSYLFVKEIDDALEKIYNDMSDNDHYNDLSTISVYFRLLRQKGIKISCDVFEKFKDDEGKFKASLINDVQGMLNLYEAAHFAIHGEDILDEALAFTTTHLKSMVSRVSPDFAEEINHALKGPIRKSVPKFEARFFMSIYSRDASHNKTLLKFAKLDYNMVQAMHQKDMSDILQWWKNLGVTTKLPYTRDRMVEEYFWILGIFFEPQYAYGIRKLTEVLCMLIIIDDTYDSFGTLEELTLFTEAVKRWDNGAINILPDYMKFIYKTLLDIFGAIGEDMAKEGRPHSIPYAKMLMQRAVQAFFSEAQWFNQNYDPTFDEYMTVALETGSCRLMILMSFVGLGATKKDFEWLCSDPKIIKAANLIGRLLNDKASHRFEQNRGHVGSVIECYMKQHGVSEEEAIRVILEQVADAWKDVNEDMLKPTGVSMSLLERVLNYCRTAELIYTDDDIDGFTDGFKLQDQIASLLRDPVII